MTGKRTRAKRRRKGKLREGFTTGTAAAAATKSALQLLLTGSPLDPISVTLPEGKVLSLPLRTSLLDGREYLTMFSDQGRR